MTIARRLIILLTVPLLALVGLGIFVRVQLAEIESRSRFVAETQVPSLAVLGDLSRSFAELRVDVRGHLLATTQTDQAKARSAFDAGEAEVTRLLSQDADRLVSDDQDRRLLNDYRDGCREWIAGARQVMTAAHQLRKTNTRYALASMCVGVGKGMAIAMERV